MTTIQQNQSRYDAWEAGAGFGAFAGGLAAIRHAAPIGRTMDTKVAVPVLAAGAAMGVATAESAAIRTIAGGDEQQERLIHAGLVGGGTLGWLGMHASNAVSRSPMLSLAKAGAAVLAATSTASLAMDGMHEALDSAGAGVATAPAMLLAAGGVGLAIAHRPPASMAASIAKEAEYKVIRDAAGVGELHGQVPVEVDPGKLLPTVPWREGWTGQIAFRGAHEAVPAKVITHVMGEEPGIVHMDPIRAMIPFQAAATPAERAKVGLEMLDEQEFLKRAVVFVDNPAGGSHSRLQIEAAELLTRGNMATISVAFAKKPAVKSLDKVSRADAVETQRLILQGIKDRIDALPAGAPRPRVMFVSNSLGNRGASDVLYEGGVSQKERYGIDRFVPFGVPSVARPLGKISDDLARGIEHPGAIRYRSESEFARLPETERDAAWQHIVTNYDDQVQIRPRDIWMRPPVPARAEDPAMGPWIPFTSFLRRAEDVYRLDKPRPGALADRAHVHTKVAPFAMKQALGDAIAPVSDEQLALIKDYSRRSEMSRYGMAPSPVFEEPYPYAGRPVPGEAY